MDAVFHWVTTYGYVAIFSLLIFGIIGLPIPDETLLVFTGYLISQGKMRPAGALLAAFAGSACGISFSYTIGRTLGLTVVHRFGRLLHLNDEKLARVQSWFNRVGHWALVAGYFIAGVRHLTAIVAGASKLRFRYFAAYAWTGALLWVSTFLTLGYFLGDNWKRLAETLHKYTLVLSILLVGVIAALYFLGRWRRNRASA